MIKKVIGFSLIVVLVSLLGACASANQTAPCPHYGSQCSKTLINSWDYNY